jgi:cytochrome c5
MKSTVRPLLPGVFVVAFLAAALAEEPPLQEPADLPDGTKLDLRKGMQVYKSACAECHATGKDGAPRLHDKAAWKDRSFQSLSIMEKHAEDGFLRMPPKGKRPILSKEEVANAVYYMSEQIAGKD